MSIERFPLNRSYKSDEEIDLIIKKWCGTHQFANHSHFVRCAVLAFDKVLEK